MGLDMYLVKVTKDMEKFSKKIDKTDKKLTKVFNKIKKNIDLNNDNIKEFYQMLRKYNIDDYIEESYLLELILSILNKEHKHIDLCHYFDYKGYLDDLDKSTYESISNDLKNYALQFKSNKLMNLINKLNKLSKRYYKYLDLYLLIQENNKVMYWRKAYSIDDWFKAQQNNSMIFTANQLKELGNICYRILNGDKKARLLLPMNKYCYDTSWYLDSLKQGAQLRTLSDEFKYIYVTN